MKLIVIGLETSPQSNLRRARRSSVDKTSSKLLGSHSPSMLTVRCRSMLKYGRRASQRYCYCCSRHVAFVLIHFCTWISLQPHFDLEPDYIIRKGIRHRIQRYTVRTEILSTFHTRVECISERHYTYWNQCMPRCRKMPKTMPEADPSPWGTWTSI